MIHAILDYSRDSRQLERRHTSEPRLFSEKCALPQRFLYRRRYIFSNPNVVNLRPVYSEIYLTNHSACPARLFVLSRSLKCHFHEYRSGRWSIGSIRKSRSKEHSSALCKTSYLIHLTRIQKGFAKSFRASWQQQLGDDNVITLFYFYIRNFGNNTLITTINCEKNTES